VSWNKPAPIRKTIFEISHGSQFTRGADDPSVLHSAIPVSGIATAMYRYAIRHRDYFHMYAAVIRRGKERNN